MTSEPVHYLSLMDVSARLRSGELKPTALTEIDPGANCAA